MKKQHVSRNIHTAEETVHTAFLGQTFLISFDENEIVDMIEELLSHDLELFGDHFTIKDNYESDLMVLVENSTEEQKLKDIQDDLTDEDYVKLMVQGNLVKFLEPSPFSNEYPEKEVK